MKRTTGAKKSKGFRGSKTHGWGAKKKHRGSGHRGGFGNSGSGKRADTKKPTIINLLGTPDFSKVGFVRPTAQPYDAINLKDLNVMVERGLVKDAVNLEELGYKKLLATGRLDKPLKITVTFASKNAIEKVKNAGGEVIVAQ